MAIASKEIRDQLNPEDFTGGMAAVAAGLRDAAPPVVTIDLWLEHACGVQRSRGQRLTDAAIEKLSKDGAMREFQEKHGLEAIMLRMQQLTEQRKVRAKLHEARRTAEENARLEAERKDPAEGGQQAVAGGSEAAASGVPVGVPKVPVLHGTPA